MHGLPQKFGDHLQTRLPAAVLAVLALLCFTQSELSQRMSVRNSKWLAFRQQNSSNGSCNYCVCFDGKTIYDIGSKSLSAANLTTTDEKQEHWRDRPRQWWWDIPSDGEMKPSEDKNVIEDIVSPAIGES